MLNSQEFFLFRLPDDEDDDRPGGRNAPPPYRMPPGCKSYTFINAPLGKWVELSCKLSPNNSHAILALV